MWLYSVVSNNFAFQLLSCRGCTCLSGTAPFAVIAPTTVLGNCPTTPHLPFRRCPILIVAPTSVLTNWQREFNTWGAFHVALCHGKQEARAAALQGVQSGQFEILITSYDTFR